MKKRRVVFAPEARDDVNALYDWIAQAADPDTALGYIERLEAYSATLSWPAHAAPPATTFEKACASSASSAA